MVKSTGKIKKIFNLICHLTIILPNPDRTKDILLRMDEHQNVLKKMSLNISGCPIEENRKKMG
jgi:hypothetical protein